LQRSEKWGYKSTLVAKLEDTQSSTMFAGSPSPAVWSSSQWQLDGEFERHSRKRLTKNAQLTWINSDRGRTEYTIQYICIAILIDMSIEPTELFACLADPTRLRLVTLLSSNEELCVCELVHALADIQPKVSRHLAMLRNCGLLTDAREGRWVYYRLATTLPRWAVETMCLTASAIEDDMPYQADRARLAGMPDRPLRRPCA